MSTRSYIGKEQADGSIKYIYCHFDGYESGVGRMLKDYYQDESLVDKLISLGSISSLEKRLEPSDGEQHNFDHPLSDVTVAYHRDRGEDLDIYTDSEEGFLEDSYMYCYLYRNGEWLIRRPGEEALEKF